MNSLYYISLIFCALKLIQIFIYGKNKFPCRKIYFLYFCPRRDGRVVDCGGLENR